MSDPQATAKKVLCIEDEHFISELYVRALNKAGYEAMVIVDGIAGLKAAQTGEYDIILIDLMIPSLTGMEVLRTLRGPGAPPIKSKIIVTTNLDVKEAVRRELEQMADGYIIKADITPHQLVDFINQIRVD